MSLHPISLVFDCDGTLVDSEAIYARVDAEILGKYGVDISAREIRQNYTGTSLLVMLDDISARTGIALPATIVDELDAAVQVLLDTQLEAVPGMGGALAQLAARGHAMAVGTNSSLPRTKANLQRVGFAHYFGDRIATRDQVKTPKPAPDIYLLAAGFMNVAPQTCVAIEDSHVGMIAAIAAGMVGIGYAPPDHPHDMAAKLVAAGAHIIIADMADLLRAVESAAELLEYM